MENEKIKAELLLKTGFVAMLSPGIRVMPRLSARLGGRGAWLSALPGAFLGGVFAGAFCWLVRCAGPGRDSSDLILEAFGKRAGKLLLLLCGAGFLLYGAFILRSSVERLLDTLYINAQKSYLLILCAASSVFAGMRGEKTIGRFCKLVFPILLTVVAATLLAGITNVRKEWLFPVGNMEWRGAVAGAMPLADVLLLLPGLSYLADLRTEEITWKRCMAMVLTADLFLGGISAVTIGSLSANVTAQLKNPYFVMVRDIEISDAIERIEAIVVAAWVITDYVLIASAMGIASKLWQKGVGAGKKKFWVALTGGLMLAASWVIPMSDKTRETLSDKIVPALFAVIGVVVPILSAGIVQIKRKTIYSKRSDEKQQI